MSAAIQGNLNQNNFAIPDLTNFQTFTPDQWKRLQDVFARLWPEETIPDQVNQKEVLQGKIEQLQIIENQMFIDSDLTPWKVCAVYATVIAATVIGFVFGGLWGLLPLAYLLLLERDCASKLHDSSYWPIPRVILYLLQYRQQQRDMPVLENTRVQIQTEINEFVAVVKNFWNAKGRDIAEEVQKRWFADQSFQNPNPWFDLMKSVNRTF